MERDQLQVAEKRIREAIASPVSDGWKEPVAEKEEEKKPQLGGPTLPKLECRVCEKVIGQTKDKTDLRLGKATIEVDKPPKAVFELLWDVNGYRHWDSTTVQEQKLVQEIEPNRTQILHVKHKVLAAASLRRDIVLLRTWKEEPNGGYLIIQTSTTSPKVPKSGDYVRAEVPFSGFLIEGAGPNKSKVTLTSVLDFGAWIHEKFVEGETVRIGHRLTKIKQRLA